VGWDNGWLGPHLPTARRYPSALGWRSCVVGEPPLPRLRVSLQCSLGVVLHPDAPDPPIRRKLLRDGLM